MRRERAPAAEIAPIPEATKHYVEGYSQPTRRTSFAESERSTVAGGYDESEQESTDTSFMGIALLAIAGIGAYFLTGKRR